MKKIVVKKKFGINTVIKSFSHGDIVWSKSVDKNLKIYEQYCDSALPGACVLR